MKQSVDIVGASRVTGILITGSLLVSIALTLLLTIHDLVKLEGFRFITVSAIAATLYLSFTQWLANNNKYVVASWLLIVLFQILAGFILLYWGLESMVGMVAACFVILLPGILMAPRHILGVACVLYFIILVIYSLHISQIVTPRTYEIEPVPSFLHIISHFTILATFALVSWVSSYQSAKSLKRAVNAENRVRKQKEVLAAELEKQSAKLRESQLQEMQQLYQFAIIGQTASMTLHELSNQLCILNLDIDDIRQRYKNSQAIENAQESMEYINAMVRKTRSQLGKQSITTSFDIIPTLRRLVKDFKPKLKQHGISLSTDTPDDITALSLYGDASNFMQILTILLNNSIEACRKVKNPHIQILLSIKNDKVSMSIVDNGPGVPDSRKESLFQPVISNKPTGLGIGLFVVSHLMKTQFKGRIKLLDTKRGAAFELQFKKYSIKNG